MSGSFGNPSKGKGSWQDAEAEYQRGWFEKFGLGFFTFDTPDEKRFEEPDGDECLRNARTSFRTAFTLLFRGCLQFQTVYPNEPGQEPRALLEFRPSRIEDAAAANGLLAEFLFRLSKGDERYFSELLRLRRKMPDPVKGDKIGIDSLPSKMALYILAVELKRELRRNPTRAEVLERMDQTTKHRRSDTGDLFDKAKLGFLKDNRGRPKKRTASE
jgi:hypothetical protein